MLRAIIFDFDGIIVDSEPVIFELTRQMAAQEGWNLTAEEYYRDYLALDDRGIVEHLFHSHERPLDSARRSELLQWKSAAYGKAIQEGLPGVPGASSFVTQCHRSGYAMAIASGSMRAEIDALLKAAGLRDCFSVLASAEDAEKSKPDPGVYLKALSGLQRLEAFRERSLRADECLAIEDAPGGIRAARAAGMKCLAIAFSQPEEQLRHADWVFENFAAVNLDQIAKAW